MPKIVTMAKILVIDDERAIRNTLKEILEFEGYTVESAENGRVGLEMALATKYDLIYTDIKMPEMDGMEVLQAYRKTVQEQGIDEAPVVMISGHGTVETAVEALKSGAYDFIVKPLDLNRLLVTTQRALEHKSLVQETKVLRKKIGASEKDVRYGRYRICISRRDLHYSVRPSQRLGVCRNLRIYRSYVLCTENDGA